MSGIKRLRKIQLGKETTAGTAVAATTIWRGQGTIEDQREVVMPVEDVGLLSNTDRSYVPKLLAAITLESTPATFEQLPHLLAMGIKNVVTGAADGGGAGKIYAYPFETTAPNTIKSYTIEGGDNQQAEEMEYAFAESISLEGKGGEAWMMSAGVLGRQVQTSSFSGSATLPTVEEILFGKTKLYIDGAGGTAGTTLISNTMLGAKIDIKTGLTPKFTADGALYFSFEGHDGPEVQASLTFEHNGSAVTEIGNWRSQTARQIRLLAEGTSFTAGTSYSKKTMLIDLVGKWTKFEKIGEQDGNDIVTGTFVARYNATAAKFGQIIVVNTLTSLP